MREEIRVCEVGNVERLEKELDQIYIGNMKLHVNIPRYQRTELKPGREQGREGKNQHLALPREPTNQGVEGSVVSGRMRRKEVWMEKKGISLLLI